ncbi:hypothetical protein, partial [Chromobacterium violaceum]|uniref:hypothetical protein n=1 Tax=Chromobacterium violaceum TaxID=536 RepID=UPI001E61FB7B
KWGGRRFIQMRGMHWFEEVWGTMELATIKKPRNIIPLPFGCSNATYWELANGFKSNRYHFIFIKINDLGRVFFSNFNLLFATYHIYIPKSFSRPL